MPVSCLRHCRDGAGICLHYHTDPAGWNVYYVALGNGDGCFAMVFIKFRFPVYEYFTIILVFLTIISFLMDIEDVLVAGMTESLLMNGTFMTGLFAGLAFGVFSWLMEREKELFRQAANLKYIPFSVIALFAGCGIVYLSFIVDFHRNIIFESLSDCPVWLQQFDIVFSAGRYEKAVSDRTLCDCLCYIGGTFRRFLSLVVCKGEWFGLYFFVFVTMGCVGGF